MRIATALLVLSFCAAAACAQAPANFLTKWSDAKKAAAKEKKPIFIHFTTRTCETCRKIEKETYTDEAVKKALADYVCVSLDCTTTEGKPTPPEVQVNLSLMERLGGSNCHYLVMVTADGVRLNAVEKYLPPDAMLKEFATARAFYRLYQEYMAYANDPKTDKNGYEFQLKTLAFYWKVQHEEHALAAAAQVLKLDPDNNKGDHVLAKLVQLEFSHDTPDKTVDLMEEVCKLDPQNEKSAYEKAMLLQILGEFREYRSLRSSDLDEAKSHLKSLLKLVKRAQDNEAKLKEPAQFYKMAVNACLCLPEYDKSIEWAQRALAVSKNPDDPKVLKDLIDQIKTAKAKLAAEPASEPARN